ncbi:MAG: DUF6291 domain-containing protein [Synergistaceae bacterium]|jgi:hypothetical protein|nr:DUF6291 domain-containing protein [Synergistaceae bacterium]
MKEKTHFLLALANCDVALGLPKDQLGALFEAVIIYEKEGRIVDLQGEAAIVFKFFVMDMDKSAAKYKAACDKKRDAINERWGRKNDTNVSNGIDSHTNDTCDTDVSNTIDMNRCDTDKNRCDVTRCDVIEPKDQNILRVADDDAPDRPADPDEYTREFEEFWQAYPRHVAKKDAYAAWRARKRDKTLDAEPATRAARTYADAMRSLGNEEAYMLYAKTFLNKGRWREWLKPDGAAYLDAVKQYRDSENRKRGSPSMPLPKEEQERQAQRDRESEDYFRREQERIEREFGGDWHDGDGKREAPQ